MRASRALTLLLLVLLVVPTLSPAIAQEGDEARPIPEEQMSVTQHSVTLDGVEIPYEATAATMHLVNDDGDPDVRFESG